MTTSRRDKTVMQIDSIIFDLDGTLWDSVDEVVLTWNRVLARYPGLRAPINRVEQESLMGLQMDEIARRLFPAEPSERQTELMEECVHEENRYLYQHGGRLYPDVECTLAELHAHYLLYIVSNCQSGYIESFLHAHRLSGYFDGFLCFGDTGLSKGENIKKIIDDRHLTRPVYIGDTMGDQKSADFAGIPFIYASYGFGKSDHYTGILQRFSDLAEWI